MDFKALSLFATTVLCLAACTNPATTGISNQDYIIGDSLGSVSSLINRDGTQNSKVAVYDTTVHRVHQFDLPSMGVTRSVAVVNPDGDHYLLYCETSNYIVDLTKKGLTIFDAQGNVDRNPVQFVGKPKSAVFRPSLGILVVYDDVSSVALLQLNPNGAVIGSWMSGPNIGSTSNSPSDLTIAAGDLTPDGNLVLAMSDGTIQWMSAASAITQQAWAPTGTFASGLAQVSWVAPLPGAAHQLLIKGKSSSDTLSFSSTFSVIDLSVGAPIGTNYDTATTNEIVVLESKSVDPHVILAKDGVQQNLLYVSGGVIKTRSFYSERSRNLVTSNLDIAADKWIYTDTGEPNAMSTSFNPDPNYNPKGRALKRFRFHDMLAQINFDLPDGAKLQMTSNNVFAYFPSELGYAVNYSSLDGSKVETKMFNQSYLH